MLAVVSRLPLSRAKVDTRVRVKYIGILSSTRANVKSNCLVREESPVFKDHTFHVSLNSHLKSEFLLLNGAASISVEIITVKIYPAKIENCNNLLDKNTELWNNIFNDTRDRNFISYHAYLLRFCCRHSRFHIRCTYFGMHYILKSLTSVHAYEDAGVDVGIYVYI